MPWTPKTSSGSSQPDFGLTKATKKSETTVAPTPIQSTPPGLMQPDAGVTAARQATAPVMTPCTVG